jgi:hypothetical protein
MTSRKEEVTPSDLKRKWHPRPAFGRKGAWPVNREVIFCAAGVLSAAPLTYLLEDAEAFAKRFGGKRLPTGSRAVTLKTSVRSRRVIQDERKRQVM